MRKNNRTCVCCYKQYTYCNNCGSDKNEPLWKMTWCSENCKTIFMTVTDYLAKEITKAEARKILETCDLEHKKDFGETIQKAIASIMATRSSTKSKEVQSE